MVVYAYLSLQNVWELLSGILGHSAVVSRKCEKGSDDFSAHGMAYVGGICPVQCDVAQKKTQTRGGIVSGNHLGPNGKRWGFSSGGCSCAGRRKSTNPNFLVRIPSGGVGVFHVKGWGPKSLVCPSFETQRNQSFGRNIEYPGILPGILPGICRDFTRDIPGSTRKV